MNNIDHPIFIQSIQFIRSKLGSNKLEGVQGEILERLIHTSGDFSIQKSLRFSSEACIAGMSAMKTGALILTDTGMAASAITSMAQRTFQLPVRSILEWSSDQYQQGMTKTASGMKHAWLEINTSHPGGNKNVIVVIGSAPTALQQLLDLIQNGESKPSLIIGMPVGFIGVEESKNRLLNSNCNYILLEGSRGGASCAAATANALLRAAFLSF